MSLVIFYAVYDNLVDGLEVGPLPVDVQDQELGWYVTDPTQFALALVPGVAVDDDLAVPEPDYYNQTTPAIWVVLILNEGQHQGPADVLQTPTFTSDESPLTPSFG